MTWKELNEARQTLRLTERQMAALLGVGHSTYTGWGTRGKVPGYIVASVEAHLLLSQRNIDALKASKGISRQDKTRKAKKMKVDGQEIYGIEVENGILLAYADGGEAVTRLNEDENPLLWPVDSNVSAYYEHPEGIVLERADAEKLGIEISML